MKDWKPTRVVALGDWIDASGYSSFASEEEFDQLIEYQEGNDLLDRFLGPGDYYLEGNHEQRWRRPGNLPKRYRRLLDPRYWLHIKERKLKWIPYSRHSVLRIGKLAFVHGFATNKYASASEAQVFGNVVHGHTHRIQRFTVPSGGETATGYNIGCMCRLDPEYASTYLGAQAWQHGFGFAYIQKSGNFDFTQVRIGGKKVFINGKEYTA